MDIAIKGNSPENIGKIIVKTSNGFNVIGSVYIKTSVGTIKIWDSSDK